MTKRQSNTGLDDPPEVVELRHQIDVVDRSILEKLNERAEIVKRVGDAKESSASPIYRAGRERDLVSALSGINSGPFPDEGIASVFREIISATRSLERRLRVAYLGPEGTYSHLAVRKQFGSCIDLVPARAISEIFTLVERGGADLGVVPMENTTEGAVTPSFDAMVDMKTTVCGEVIVPVAHQLLSRSGRLEDIGSVVSHPQPLGQCREWLDRNLPTIPRVEAASTALAAERAKDDPSLAAIGSTVAAEVNDLQIAAADIEDRRGNTTRFVVIGNDAAPPTGNDLTSILYTIRRDESGALHKLLEPFSRHGVTLTSIQSRPIQGHHWEYHFFLDVEGHISEERVAAALRDAADCADSYRVLGSFPRAEDVDARGGKPS